VCFVLESTVASRGRYYAEETSRSVKMELDSMRIVVADDDRVVRRIVSVKLSGLGCEIEEAEDGQEALELLQEDPPDLLITDSLMPRMNGLQLVRSVRGIEKLSALPVIMLTSRHGEQDIIEGLEAGLDDYVVKPFSPDELAARVRTVLWRASRRV
jgi:DNA-binding response OmpR family regulator